MRPPRAESLAGDYLMQAVEHLHDAGDPAHLFDHWRRHPSANRDHMESEGRRRRLRAARTAVLLTAFSGEAYVNEFLDAHGALAKWDREATFHKFLKGTADAYGSRLFFHDREGYQELVDLYKLRDRLVHPKPGFGAAGEHGLAREIPEKFEALFALPKVAEYIVAVAGAADVLVPRAFGFETFDLMGMTCWRGRSILRGYARRNRKLPAWDAPSERALFRQAGDYLMSLEPWVPGPTSPWTRLKDAKAARAAESEGGN